MGKASISRGRSISDRLSPHLQKELEFFSLNRAAAEMQEFRQQSISKTLSKLASEYLANAKRYARTRPSTLA